MEAARRWERSHRISDDAVRPGLRGVAQPARIFEAELTCTAVSRTFAHPLGGAEKEGAANTSVLASNSISRTGRILFLFSEYARVASTPQVVISSAC
ncbi:hypothetical protein A0H81_05501 [Grifola frondosa]|uniref:Uncharacterized protein n=1 Tax=Grifola frondosa TaxID=5627 RepID=A0A1C7MD15_GRIFR|nr:hypothetical protein A0H81_05501 [Grifola frondosa]